MLSETTTHNDLPEDTYDAGDRIVAVNGVPVEDFKTDPAGAAHRATMNNGRTEEEEDPSPDVYQADEVTFSFAETNFDNRTPEEKEAYVKEQEAKVAEVIAKRTSTSPDEDRAELLELLSDGLFDVESEDADYGRLVVSNPGVQGENPYFDIETAAGRKFRILVSPLQG